MNVKERRKDTIIDGDLEEYTEKWQKHDGNSLQLKLEIW